MAIKEFLHVSICISDPDRSVPFYRDILGFELVREIPWSSPGPSRVMDVGDSEFTTWLMTNGGYRLELIHYARPQSPPLSATPKMNSLGLSHMTVGVDDARKTMQELKARGVKVLEHTLGAFLEDERDSMFLFEDPDGFIIEAYTVRPDGKLPYGER
ncbi:MAG: VOC family protein [Dehalococcoidia bacterium]